MAKPIIVVPYDPRWPELFAKLRATLSAALGDVAVNIEHVGSTAVPGLAAKPIIDVDVVISSWKGLQHAIGRLAKIGYVHEGDLGIPGREAFAAPRGETDHHLYVCAADSVELQRHITFRDKLRSNQTAAQQYAELKFKLANDFYSDRMAYTEGKSAWIAAFLKG